MSQFRVCKFCRKGVKWDGLGPWNCHSCGALDEDETEVGGRYRTIVADPPWPYRESRALQTRSARDPDGHGANVSSVNRYGAMLIEELESLLPEDVTEDNAHLYLWTTNAFMREAHRVAEGWGFKPKTILTWVKTHKGDSSRPSMKTGYYFRGATEHVLFCVRGSLRLQTSEGLPTAYMWPRLPHSVKPDAFYDLVELASPGPYLELFARRERLGWHSWGNESLGTYMFRDVAPITERVAELELWDSTRTPSPAETERTER